MADLKLQVPITEEVKVDADTLAKIDRGIEDADDLIADLSAALDASDIQRLVDEDSLVEFYPRLARRVSPGERSDPND